MIRHLLGYCPFINVPWCRACLLDVLPWLFAFDIASCQAGVYDTLLFAYGFSNPLPFWVRVSFSPLCFLMALSWLLSLCCRVLAGSGCGCFTPLYTWTLFGLEVALIAPSALAPLLFLSRGVL